jgi:hypothetical protein
MILTFTALDQKMDQDFAALAARVSAGNVTYDDVADMLLRGLGMVGLRDAGDRADIVAALQEDYPTQEALVAHMQEMVAGYTKYCAMTGTPPNLATDSDAPGRPE